MFGVGAEGNLGCMRCVNCVLKSSFYKVDFSENHCIIRTLAVEYLWLHKTAGYIKCWDCE